MVFFWSPDNMAGESRINHGTRNLKNLLQHALVVDNDPASLDSLKGLLQQCCYYVITVSNASKALELAMENKGSFDVLIADIDISSIEGFELLESLANVLPVILLSPTDDQKLSEVALAKGACHCLKKPVQLEDLKNIPHYINRRKQTLDNISSHSKDKHPSICKDEHNVDPVPKKRRLVWDDRLKEKFVKAYNELGSENIRPKNLQEKMDEPGLSRSHIASHLQKYKEYLKRIEAKKLQQVATSQMLSNGMMVCGRPNAQTKVGNGGSEQFIRPDHSSTSTGMSQMQHGMMGSLDCPSFMNMSLGSTFNSGHHHHLVSPQNSRSCCHELSNSNLYQPLMFPPSLDQPIHRAQPPSNEVSQTQHPLAPFIGPNYSCTSTRMSQMEHGMMGRQDCRPSYEPSNNSNGQPPMLTPMLDQPALRSQPPSNEVCQTQHLPTPADDDDWANMIDNLMNIPSEEMINQNQEIKEGNGSVSLSDRLDELEQEFAQILCS